MRAFSLVLLLALPAAAQQQRPIKLQDEGVDLGKGWIGTINCSGSGITCTRDATTGTGTIEVTSGGGGVPATIPAITYATTGDLSAERVLSAGNYTTVDLGTAGQAQVDWAHGLTCGAGSVLTTSGTSAMVCTSSISTATSATTATQLAADPTACSAGQYVSDIAANGTLTCSTPTAAVPDATASVTGGVRLTGDLGGTATSPAVVDNSHNHNGTTVSDLDTGDITTGTLSQARGGTGAGALTCGAGGYLTSNGTAYLCSSLVDATGSTNGVVRLAGDLSGTAAAPTVSNVQCSACISVSEVNATGTPSSSTFLRGDGQWATPAGGSGPTAYRVTGSNITNSTTTPTTVLSWSIAANTEMAIHCILSAQGTATSLPRFNVNGPASPTVSFETRRYTTTSAQTLLVLQALSAAAQTAACTSGCNATVLPTRISGTILNGANAGTVSLQVTSSTAGQTVTVFRGSTCWVQ